METGRDEAFRKVRYLQRADGLLLQEEYGQRRKKQGGFRHASRKTPNSRARATAWLRLLAPNLA
jgi:hypothetical protein